MLPHESNRSRKPLFKTGETRQSDFTNWTLWFYRDRQRSRAPLGYDDELFLRSSGIWTVEKLEPRQLKELWRQIVYPIDEKEKETKN
jgi:hypothetical protein